MGTVLRGGTIVTAVDCYQAEVRIEGDIIVALGNAIAQQGDTIIDVGGCYLFPGGIDPHTHLDLSVGDMTTADDFASGTAAALVGGTTTIIDYATQNKGETLKGAFENWQQKAQQNSYTDYGFHMAITDWQECIASEMGYMVNECGIISFKMYMAYKNSLQVDDGVLFKALQRCKELGALLAVHCENGDVIAALVEAALHKGHTKPVYHMLTRPDGVEREAVSRAISLAEIAGAPLYIVHLSAAAALDCVIQAKMRGVAVSVETCPQYLLLDASLYLAEDFSGAKYVMSPPLRQKEDQTRLWNGLATGLIDTIATDHCSFNYQGQKDRGQDDFSKIPNGIPGLETRLGLLYTYGVLTKKINLQQFVALTSTNAAKLFGLFPRKGTIAVGSHADIVVWNPKPTSVISAKEQKQRVDYTPYEGCKQQGQVARVFLRGQQVVGDGQLQQTVPTGKYLFRKPF